MRLDRAGLGFVVGLLGCFGDAPQVESATETEGETSSGSASTGSSVTAMSASASSGEPTSSTTTSGSTSETDTNESSSGQPGCADASCLVDIVVVVDNSGTMANEQSQIGLAMPRLEAALREGGYDAHVMFTTTDLGNPLCTTFEPKGYDPIGGTPVATACTQRLEDFISLDGTLTVSEACTQTCPNDVAPDGQSYVAFGPAGDNVPDVQAVDVDGDGTMDPAAAQALACLAPQGINGCGYESPLEAMLVALRPDAAWNTGPDPFLREGSTVGIVILTDEADCSMADFGAMMDVQYMEDDPFTGAPAASSAICWNAGVSCTGASPFFDDCTSSSLTPLQELSRYVEFVENGLDGHDVVMLGLLGIPTVTDHLVDSPYTPTAGGVDDLVYHDWVDGEYPAGDMLPEDVANGVTAAEKQWTYGIGPGCTGGDAMSGFTGQAIPPVRTRELCEGLDVGSDPVDRRCCMESICDANYSSAMTCMLGLVDNTFR